MEYIILFLLVGVVVFAIVKFIKHQSLYPFMPFKYNFGKRRNTFFETMDLLKKTDAKLIIETGTSREGLKGAKSNGAATIVFGKWAKENNAFLHSVDININSVENAQKEVDKQGLTKYVRIHHSDSLKFLNGFKEKVDFVYLDSYDYSSDPEVQKKSQEHHLKEFLEIEHALHKNSIVLIDDCNLPNGGKGKLVIDYMLKNSWKILTESYQVLLVRKDFLV